MSLYWEVYATPPGREELAFSEEVPAYSVELVKQIAEVGDDDPYKELTFDQFLRISKILQLEPDPNWPSLDFFVEGYPAL